MRTEVTFMRIGSILSVALSLFVAGPAVGCGGSVASEPAVSASSASTKAPIAQASHGPVKVVADALGDVALTASQRADIEQLAADAEARHAGARAAGKDMMLALAAQVEAGSIDRGALQPKIDALAAAVSAAQPADRAAFERLHQILGPEQRAAFADALEARVRDRLHQGGDAGQSMGGLHGRHPLKQWADDLGLTEPQRVQIKVALEQSSGDAGRARYGHEPPPWMDGGRRGEKLLDAFKQDRFVMDEVAPARDIGRQASGASERFLSVAQAALPVLTPQQRSLAAQKLRARADEADVTAPPTL
jgi:Spy/CpxP family protein refolding chaperone